MSVSRGQVSTGTDDQLAHGTQVRRSDRKRGQTSRLGATVRSRLPPNKKVGAGCPLAYRHGAAEDGRTSQNDGNEQGVWRLWLRAALARCVGVAMNDFLTSSEARSLLGVKPQTLYAYVSRGLIRTVPVNESGKKRLYQRTDVEKLRSRADARAGHGPAAAAAMQHGEPIIVSEITELTPAGPCYRGRPALELAENASFEQVANLLWVGELTPHEAWGPFLPLPAIYHELARQVHESYRGASILRLFATYALGCAFEPRDEPPLLTARRILLTFAGCFGYLTSRGAYRPPRDGQSIAQAVLESCELPTDAQSVRAIDVALILLADAELAPETFVARVAASCRADLAPCIVAAIESSSGQIIEHRRVAELLDDVRSREHFLERVAACQRRGEAPPGFNPSLYAGHDPRALRFVELARARSQNNVVVEIVSSFLKEDARSMGLYVKALLGIDVFARAMRLPAGAVPGLFFLARAAGWVAHILEQYASGTRLRPRAKFQREPILADVFAHRPADAGLCSSATEGQVPPTCVE